MIYLLGTKVFTKPGPFGVLISGVHVVGVMMHVGERQEAQILKFNAPS